MSIALAINYISTWLGLAAVAGYAVTFFVVPYNSLYLSGESGYDENDIPYILAMAECAVAGLTFVMGVIGAGNKTKPALLTMMIFFIVFVVFQGTFSVMRVWNLGLLGDDMARTCSDTMNSGCPTTRFESANSLGRDILFTEPLGGECNFFFWKVGGVMPTRSEWERENFTPCQDPDNMCAWRMETYMDWSKRSSYGWRDDPTALRAVDSSTNSQTTFPKVHNMQELMKLQVKYNRTLVQSVQYDEQPSIAYCWYWGCHSVCQPVRWIVNRWWLTSSLVMFVVQIINMGLTTALWLRPRAAKVKTIAEAQSTPSFVMQAPVLGRRNRRLNTNPDMLHF